MQAGDLVLEMPEHALDLMIAAFLKGKVRLVRPQQCQPCRPRGQVLIGEVQASGE